MSHGNFGEGRVCPGWEGKCGVPVTHWSASGLCRACVTKMMQSCALDYAKDACGRCGKHPLHVNNKTGYCRGCSRGHMRKTLYPAKRQSLDSSDPACSTVRRLRPRSHHAAKQEEETA